MDFFWPERNRESEGVELVKMFEIVDKIKCGLLENLEISPQLLKAPADLLTVYAIYDVFSIKDEKWENSRVWFLERYKNRLVHYLQNKSSLPEYRSFVRKLFNDLFDVRLKKEIEKMDLDSYLSENKNLKPILDIIWWGVEVKSWEEFKEIVVKKCREFFPYAEKRFDKIVNSKNFNKQIMELFFEEKKEQFLSILSEVIDDEIEVIEESRERQIKDLENQILESWEDEKLLKMLNLLKNWEWNIFIEMDRMIKMLSIFEAEDFNLEEYFLKFYVNKVMERFKESSDKRNPAYNLKHPDSQVETEDNFVDYVQETPVFFWEAVRRVSLEKEEIIDSIVQKLYLRKKIWESFKKYLMRLLSNWRNCRMSSLTDRFWIIKFDEDVKILFKKLWIVVEYDHLDKWESKKTDIENVEKEEVCEVENWEDLVDENEMSECSLDPVEVCLKQVAKYNYGVINEKKLRKQIEELCDTDFSIKQILCVEMQKDSFWNPKKKHGKSYYTIEIGVTWIRFILFRCKDWKFIIDWVYSHDDYQKRVKEVR